MIEGNHSMNMQKHNGNLKYQKWCMIQWVWLLRYLPCKRESNSQLECLQMLFEDLDSFPSPQGVCCNSWNDLNPPRTSCSIPTADGPSEICRWWIWCSSWCLSVWIIHMWCIECVWIIGLVWNGLKLEIEFSHFELLEFWVKERIMRKQVL